MRKTRVLFSTIAFITLISGTGVASGAIPGFAVYAVQFSTHGVTKSFTINQTVTQTSNPAIDRLLLSATFSSSNVTYSRFVNSTKMLQPFLPALTNQTFSFANDRASLSVKLTQNGSSTVTFQGGTHTLTSYSFAAEYSMRNQSGSAKGAIYTFPSGLIYSLREDLNGASSSSLVVTLKATSLPLTVGAAAPGVQIASIGLGAGVAASAVLIGLGVRIRRRKNVIAEKRPEFWVD